jgi:hypothetical protein
MPKATLLDFLKLHERINSFFSLCLSLFDLNICHLQCGIQTDGTDMRNDELKMDQMPKKVIFKVSRKRNS